MYTPIVTGLIAYTNGTISEKEDACGTATSTPSQSTRLPEASAINNICDLQILLSHPANPILTNHNLFLLPIHIFQ